MEAVKPSRVALSEEPSPAAELGAQVSDLANRWAGAALAAGIAEAVTYPLDVTKIRLQLENELMPGKSKGMVATAFGVLRSEGAGALYRGTPAAVIRQAVYGGIGIGMYAPCRSYLFGDDAEHMPLWRRFLTGGITGGLGQAVAIPADVVKVRLQADGRMEMQGLPARYSGTWNAFRRIPLEEGFLTFYKGLIPSMARAMVINGAGIGTYDETKRVAAKYLSREEGGVTHAAAAVVSSFVSALVSTPIDIVKTRVMTQPKGSGDMYRGVLDCAVRTVRSEGVQSLYKGFAATYARLAPWQMVFFVTFEELLKKYSGHYL